MTNVANPVSCPAAFWLGFLPGMIGPTIVNRAIVGHVAETQPDEKFQHAVSFAKKTLQLPDSKAENAQRQLMAGAAKFGLSLPEPPPTGPGYERWLEAVRGAIRPLLAAQDAAAQVAYQAGVAAGELYLSLKVGRTLSYLRTSAPEHAQLGMAAGNVGRTLFGAQKRLEEALRNSALPATAVPIAQKLAELFVKAPDLANVKTSESFKEYGDWAPQVTELVESIGQAFAG